MMCIKALFPCREQEQYLAILRYVLADKGKFGKFAYYCWAVGLISLVASFFVK